MLNGCPRESSTTDLDAVVVCISSPGLVTKTH